MVKEFFKNLFQKSKNNGHKQFLYIIFIIGTVIMLCGGAGFNKIDILKNNAKSADSKPETYDGGEEERLKKILSEIKDVGETDVMVSYENEDEKSGSEYVSVFAQNQNLKTKKIKGVIVVCRGAKNPEVKQRIVEAVCALTGAYEHNVAVLEKR